MNEAAEFHYSPQERLAMAARLNTLFPSEFPWRPVKARTEHIDLFGDHIAAGDEYYSDSAPFERTVRLSLSSVDKVCFLLFSSSPMLVELTNHLLAERAQIQRAAVARLAGNSPDATSRKKSR